MAVIRFSAVNRGELPSWLAAGATFYLANNFQAFPRKLVAKGSRDETLSGVPEGWLDALQSEYAIQTDFIPIAERDLWRAFLTSVLNAETFAIDFDARQLLGNPGLESGATSPWFANSSGTGLVVNSSAGLQALGRYAGQVTMIPSVGAGLVDQGLNAGAAIPGFAVSAGQTALVQALFKRDESSLPNRNAEAAINFRDSGGTNINSATTSAASSATVGYQLVNVTGVAAANATQMNIRLQKQSPHNTNEAGRWLFDECLLAVLSSWSNVWLVDNSVQEEQVGGVGVRYSFRVKKLP